MRLELGRSSPASETSRAQTASRRSRSPVTAESDPGTEDPPRVRPLAGPAGESAAEGLRPAHQRLKSELARLHQLGIATPARNFVAVMSPRYSSVSRVWATALI